MKLYGSTTSPFVRRLRLLLVQSDYQFVPFNIFGNDRDTIKKTNPTLKVPIFEDVIDGRTQQIFDSGNVFRYLYQKFEIQPLSVKEQNDLSVIDACCDSLVNMMILTRSGVEVNKDKLYFNIQRERQLSSFEYLEDQIAQGEFSNWRYPSIALLATVEWANFRSLFDFTGYPNIQRFIKDNSTQPGVLETAPKD
ncbi:glutathione S-transferase family protein [Psychrosphaera sp. B3R10]|uniref:glutathione S-transferase family protein n=1 Tax=unclassified Psychrosphaera TaxID=2641570 RepID=UPI001C091644|nr:glutathione S-transferase family protein [Psychrosphaera sp. 1_MG-2023]MBU2881375.1 glutathione S-transferase family protein [Psychrosphaera sp. I2R16]MBU2988474.1 glutathione S-transferase family protein [Psychrosphaera sp. B3R10]MDO6720026.1 glutathione S-transferase family protein [Psychrosphaera sp. 1_MG-2023]